MKKASPSKEEEKKAKPKAQVQQKIKLSWRESRELEALPEKLEALEKEQSDLIARMSEGSYHTKPVDEIKADKSRLDALENEISAGYARWEELSAKADEAAKA